MGNSHYACIGFEFEGQQDHAMVLNMLVDRSEREVGPGGERSIWRDTSGAALVCFFDDDGMRCAKPTFVGAATTHVRASGVLADDAGCPYCALTYAEVLEDGEMAYPLPLERDDAHQSPIPSGVDTPFAITAFAEDVNVHTDLGAYASAGSQFAATSVIPSGLFTDEGAAPSAHAIITGVVADAGLRTNSFTRRPFQWARLDTYAAVVDVVMPAAASPLAPGNVLQGGFWLVGRPVTS